MSKGISFYVIGEPKAQPRPRAFVQRFGNTYQARVYNAGTAEAWKSAIAATAAAYKPQKPFVGPVCVELVFYFPRPKSHYRTGKHTGHLRLDAPQLHFQKPDRDNLDKAVLDCLKVLGFFADDSQACKGEPSKYWCPVDMQPGCQITIIPLDEPSESENQREMFNVREVQTA